MLKAMGSAPAFVYGIGVAQAVLLGLGGLLPALFVGALVLWFIQDRTHLEAALGAVVFGKMLAITLAAALGAAAVVVGRVHRADPAALY